MSSISYKIMNKLAGLSMYLSSDNKSIVGEYTESVDNRENWTVERTHVGSVTARIKSKQNGLYVGYEGSPGQGVKIIVGADQVNKLWDIDPDSPPDYKIKVHGTHWVIAFDKNYYPGIPATLEWENIPEEINQVWDFSLL